MVLSLSAHFPDRIFFFSLCFTFQFFFSISSLSRKCVYKLNTPTLYLKQRSPTCGPGQLMIKCPHQNLNFNDSRCWDSKVKSSVTIALIIFCPLKQNCGAKQLSCCQTLKSPRAIVKCSLWYTYIHKWQASVPFITRMSMQQTFCFFTANFNIMLPFSLLSNHLQSHRDYHYHNHLSLHHYGTCPTF